MRTEFLPFHTPLIGEEEIQCVVETMRSGWLTTGCQTRRLEEAFRAIVGARHAIALNSGTAALHLALDALDVRDGDEVIVPTMTFAATAEVVAYCRATPVLVDCAPDTLNIDPDAVERALTPRTKAIVPVHFAGRPCAMDRLLEIAGARGVAIVEDAAHAFPAWYGDRMIGAIGDITCFSFYATKTITTGEGGMATTDRDDLADRMRIMSLHGISRDAWKRYTADGTWYYEILRPGFKYNLTDIAAAIGLAQLEKRTRLLDARRRIAERYEAGFAALPEIRRPAWPDDGSAWHLYVIQLDLDRLTIGRNEFIEGLKAARIGASVHFIPLHLHPYYRASFGYTPADFPNASAAFERIVSLPIFPGMTETDADDVIETVARIVVEHRR
jgi:perosamine synthetase